HVSFLLSWQCWLCGRDFAERFRPSRFKIRRTWTALRSQKRICARNKAKGCTMPRDLKLFYFAFFPMRGRAKKILVFMIRNSSCKFDNVANMYV
ncbi:hypothetical protein GBAR_LOCUS23045, partial [Geodia barretti]